VTKLDQSMEAIVSEAQKSLKEVNAESTYLDTKRRALQAIVALAQNGKAPRGEYQRTQPATCEKCGKVFRSAHPGRHAEACPGAQVTEGVAQ